MLEASRTEIDGVPTFWVDSGRELLRATLRFRVGVVDETLATHGQLHLLEHLGMSHLDAPPYLSHNASVSPVFTSFDVEGPPADVVRLLGEVSSRLAQVDGDHVTHEARVLEQEARLRPVGSLAAAYYCRWGARGPGLVWYREFGLVNPDLGGLSRLAARAFAAGNAALALDGPPPAELRLRLNAGGSPIPVALPAPAHPFPMAGATDAPGIYGLVRDTAAARIGLAILHRRVVEKLSSEREGTAWQGDLDVLGEDAHVALLGRPGERAAVETAAVLTELSRLADSEVAQAEIDEQRAAWEQSWAAPGSARQEPWLAMDRYLLGRPSSAADERAELVRVAAPAIRAFAHEWQRSLLVTADTKADAPPGLPWLDDSDSRIEAARVDQIHRVLPGVPVDRHARIVRAGRLLQYQSPEVVATLDLDRLALVGNRSDGQRLLISEAGERLVIEPTHWRNAESLLQVIDTTVPADRRVELPPRAADEIPRRLSVAGRVRVALFGTPVMRSISAALLLVLGLGLVVWALVATGAGPFVGIVGVAAASAAVPILLPDRKRQ